MIDPSFDRVVPVSDMSVYALQDARIKELEQQTADLENKLSLKTQQWEYAGESSRHYAAQIDAFEEALKRNEWDFDGDTLESLADIFSLTLEREYMVEITVKFCGGVTVPKDYDIDDLENDLSASIDTHHYGNSSVVVDFMEEDMEISYEEI